MWTEGSTQPREAPTEPFQSKWGLDFDVLFFRPEWPNAAACTGQVG